MASHRYLGSLLLLASAALGCTSDDDDGGSTADGGDAPRDAAAPTDDDDGGSPAGDWCADCDLATQMERLMESGSTDCGEIRASRFDDGDEDAGTSASDADVLACVATALEREEPFTVVLRQQGIDSSVGTGWVGTGDGTVYMLSYDSNICGAVGGCTRSCGPRVHRATCSAPAVAGADEVIDCGSREREELCGPPE